MKKQTILLVIFVVLTHNSYSQIYYKINTLYALSGVINPAVEFPVAKQSSYQIECVASPFLSFTEDGINKPVHFFIFMNEYRRFFRERNKGWYAGGNFSMMGFDMYKPKLMDDFKFRLDPYRRSRGYGFMTGICVGYEYCFKENWILDAFFGWSYMLSWYNGYTLDGTIIMVPNGHEDYEHEDPWNASAEWYPNKIGSSVGYKF
jgi:hypothetical protein